MIQWLRRGALGLVIGLCVLALPTAALAYGPGAANNTFGLTLSTSVGRGGEPVTASAASGPCVPGSRVPISLIRAIPAQTPTLLGATTVNSAGGLDADTVIIPVGTPPGNYNIFATCTERGGAAALFTAAFVVLGPVAVASVSSPLAFTGIDVALIVLVALALIAGGALLIWRARRSGHH